MNKFWKKLSEKKWLTILFKFGIGLLYIGITGLIILLLSKIFHFIWNKYFVGYTNALINLFGIIVIFNFIDNQILISKRNNKEEVD